MSESSEALSLVEQGHALVRTQDNRMESIARIHPRDMKALAEKLWAELDAFPEEAGELYYSIPYASTRGGGGEKTMVEGPTIRAAEMIVRHWGNCNTTWIVIDESDASFDVQGVFMDLETNMRQSKNMRISKLGYNRKEKQFYKLSDDKMTQALNSGGAKAQRNAIVAGVSRALVNKLWQRAKKTAEGDSPQDLLPKAELHKILKAFSEFGADQDLIERGLQKRMGEWRGHERGRLIGMYNALKDGNGTLEEVLGKLSVKETKSKAKNKKTKEKTSEEEPPPVEDEVVDVEVVAPEVAPEAAPKDADDDDPFAS